MDEAFAILTAAIVLGVIPGAVAYRKGHDFVGWWIYGALLFVIATPHAFSTGTNRRRLDLRLAEQGYGRCPACAEMVREQALKCAHCQSPLVADE